MTALRIGLIIIGVIGGVMTALRIGLIIIGVIGGVMTAHCIGLIIIGMVVTLIGADFDRSNIDNGFVLIFLAIGCVLIVGDFIVNAFNNIVNLCRCNLRGV